MQSYNCDVNITLNCTSCKIKEKSIFPQDRAFNKTFGLHGIELNAQLYPLIKSDLRVQFTKQPSSAIEKGQSNFAPASKKTIL